MNIFRLDNDPVVAAEMAIDKHAIKMSTESAQLLHTVLRQYGFEAEWLYRSLNPKHPSALWTATNRSNFEWLCKHGLALCQEYTKRYKKRHKCQTLIELAQAQSSLLPVGTETPLNLVMPEQFMSADVVYSYRLYYAGAKFRFASWKTQQPSWWDHFRALVKAQNLEVENEKDDGVKL